MEKRICPSCKTNWYSADSSHDWTCDKCGETITKDDVETYEIHKEEGNEN